MLAFSRTRTGQYPPVCTDTLARSPGLESLFNQDGGVGATKNSDVLVQLTYTLRHFFPTKSIRTDSGEARGLLEASSYYYRR